MKAERKDDRAKVARSYSPQRGKRGGSTKDPVKQAYIEEGKKPGVSVSQRSIERRLAKDRGAVKKPGGAKKSKRKEKSKSEPKLDPVQQRVVASCNCRNEMVLVLDELREKRSGTKDKLSDIIDWIEEKLEAFAR